MPQISGDGRQELNDPDGNRSDDRDQGAAADR
jgi:hypothetical protein